MWQHQYVLYLHLGWRCVQNIPNAVSLCAIQKAKVEVSEVPEALKFIDIERAQVYVVGVALFHLICHGENWSDTIGWGLKR